jgi:hypothetical protein
VLAVALVVSGCTVHIGFRDKFDGVETSDKIRSTKIQTSTRLGKETQIVLKLQEIQEVEIRTFQILRRMEIRAYRRGLIIGLLAGVGGGLLYILLMVALVLSTPSYDDEEPVS